jgi:excisionase family DNA binding protein
MPLSEEMLRAREVAEVLQISVSSLWRGVAAGRIPAPVTVGKRSTRWKQSALQAWLDSNCTAAVKTSPK